MSNTTIVLKKSATPGNTPSVLANGELAINYADGKLYYRAANGTISAISGSSGTPVYSFATVNANSSLILAASSSDVLSIIPGNNITISANTTAKSITINSTTSTGANTTSLNVSNVLVSNVITANTANITNLNVVNHIVTGNANVVSLSATNIYANNYFYANGAALQAGSGGGGSGNGIAYIAASAPPSSSNTVGSQWYNTGTDTLYEYTYDGTNYYWVDITSSAVASNGAFLTQANVTYTTITANTIYALSNAASGTYTRVEYNIPHPFLLMGAS